MNSKPTQYNFSKYSLIMGIVALVCLFQPYAQFVFGMVGLLLGYFSRNGQQLKKSALAGMILSVTAMIISVLMVYYIYGYLTLLRDPANAQQFNTMLKQIYEIFPDFPVPPAN